MDTKEPKPKFIPNIKFIPMEQIEKMSYKELKEAGLIRETQVMYHNIREDVLKLCKETGLKIDEIRKVIGEKYFISQSSVHGILYRKWGSR